MKPYAHQIELAKEIRAKLKKYRLCYFTAEERTGKTLSAILVAEKCYGANILVVTKKNALEGWRETFKKYKTKKSYTLTNYHQICNLEGSYDFIILDESHNYISGYPKKSKIWKELAKFTKNKDILFMSATPFSQGMQQIYNPLALSSFSPFNKYKNFYIWFAYYGIESHIMTGRGLIKQYNKTHSEVILNDIKHLLVTKTRSSLGFEHEPVDRKHYIELNETTKKLYNKLVKNKVAKFSHTDIILDSVLKERVTLHQIEGGLYKADDYCLDLKEESKIDYILYNWGDCEDVVIMCHYIYELEKLSNIFKRAKVLSSSKFSEGVDLSHIETLIIYSQDFSTSKHIQRRARQCNINRKNPIIVHYLLVYGGVSEQVYNTVCINKKNFTDKIYEETFI